ncbi:MAG: DUF3849 domain-containing protein [Clostridiales bacterium]|nr:DUF3849 domain-containing protein [Clostridiales bacterium]
MKRELSDDERAFCRSLFGTAFQASTDCLDIERVVYPYDIPTARKRLETDACHASANRNAECARAIDAAIHASSYKTFHYNLDLAAMKMILDYGFPRVNAVLSRQLRVSDYDGRYSRANLTWARGFSAVDTAFRYAHLDAHPTLLDSFTKYVRDFYDELGAERFALAGRETSGEIVAGYEIIRSVTFGDGQGFAIAHNPEAISPYVVWQFKRDDGAINAFWGYYCSDERAAADNYTLRAAIHDQLLRKEEIHATAAPDQSPEPASGIAFSLAKWREADDAIDAPWREDARYREHKDGALFYKGGENGQYLRVSSNGTITVGRYAHAKPGIEDAVLTAGISQQLPSYDHALLLAAHLGGERFRSDLFGESVSLAAAIESRLEAGKPEAEPIVQPITDASGNTYTSVLGAIDRAKSAPKPPRKAKAPDRQKSGEEL